MRTDSVQGGMNSAIGNGCLESHVTPSSTYVYQWRSARALPKQDHFSGLQQDGEIQKQVVVFCVVQIVL